MSVKVFSCTLYDSHWHCQQHCHSTINHPLFIPCCLLTFPVQSLELWNRWNFGQEKYLQATTCRACWDDDTLQVCPFMLQSCLIPFAPSHSSYLVFDVFPLKSSLSHECVSLSNALVYYRYFAKS